MKEMEQITIRAKDRMRRGERASEMAAFFQGEDENLVDKALFVAWLGELLRMTREEVEEMRLVDNETAEIVYHGGYTQKINIAADSYLAIIKDTIKQGDF